MEVARRCLPKNYDEWLTDPNLGAFQAIVWEEDETLPAEDLFQGDMDFFAAEIITAGQDLPFFSVEDFDENIDLNNLDADFDELAQLGAINYNNQWHSSINGDEFDIFDEENLFPLIPEYLFAIPDIEQN